MTKQSTIFSMQWSTVSPELLFINYYVFKNSTYDECVGVVEGRVG